MKMCERKMEFRESISSSSSIFLSPIFLSVPSARTYHSRGLPKAPLKNQKSEIRMSKSETAGRLWPHVPCAGHFRRPGNA